MKIRKVNILLLTVALLCSVTSAAQTGPRRGSSIDSLNYGGDLGGNTDSPPTAIERATNTDDSKLEYFTLNGTPVATPHRNQIYITRWREGNRYITRKRSK